MSQQLGIILMVDVVAALKANTLDGNAYLYDNMKMQGSEGQGTDSLISAINGSRFCDGSQANEQVLNWLPYGVGSLPPTLPKSFLANKSKNSDLQAIDDVKKLLDRIENTEKDKFSKVEDVLAEIKKISKGNGIKTKVKAKRKNVQHDIGNVGQKLMDVTGNLISHDDDVAEVNHLTPIITDITGEAVDKNIIYPAAYGSPDMVTDGWYWAASVDTSRPGTYAYTMHVEMYKLSRIEGECTWVPVDMTCQAYIKISSDPKINGFTGGGMTTLPIPMK